jgi:hypothetical protein
MHFYLMITYILEFFRLCAAGKIATADFRILIAYALKYSEYLKNRSN